MSSQIQKLHEVWDNFRKKDEQNSELPQINFEDLNKSIISTGPFYFYVIDFFDMSLSNISPSIYEIHNFELDNVKFQDILDTLHPDDIDFISHTESAIAKFFYDNLGYENSTNYKANYCFRAKLKNGEYGIINHQSIQLSFDKNGGIGKSLNIHTVINHLTYTNNYKYSLIGLNGEPSYMNLSHETEFLKEATFSKREIEIIRFISEGNNNHEIAEKLFISPFTVKEHRKNIIKKSNCKNTSQLIKNCVLQGLI